MRLKQSENKNLCTSYMDYCNFESHFYIFLKEPHLLVLCHICVSQGFLNCSPCAKSGSLTLEVWLLVSFKLYLNMNGIDLASLHVSLYYLLPFMACQKINIVENPWFNLLNIRRLCSFCRIKHITLKLLK